MNNKIDKMSVVKNSPVQRPVAPGPAKVRVMLVDDQPIVCEAVRRMLENQADIELYCVSDGSVALDEAQRFAPTVILQDLVMPGVDGFNILQQYRSVPTLADVPVIVMSAKDDPKLKAHSFGLGANDYLIKLPDRIELLARLRYHSAGHISRMQRDEVFHKLRESEAALAKANIELRQLAALDGLTGIANRRRFDEVLDAEWQRGRRDGKPLSVLMCDIDYFKRYNDHFGHPGGDACLRQVAALLATQMRRPPDLAARYGGEEFALVLPATDAAGASLVAEACLAQLRAHAIAHPGSPHAIVTMSIGVASTVPDNEGDVDLLIRRADKALYAAKSDGRNRVVMAPPQA
jgi:two-component system chemotaxis family response regulator WspR